MSLSRPFGGWSARCVVGTTFLVILTLGDRANPAQWPIWPVDKQGTLSGTYGQFSEAGGVHFHEGIDILAPAGSHVEAIEPGTVVGVHRDQFGYKSSIVVATAGTRGWNYVHVFAGSKPRKNMGVGIAQPWEVGDEVKLGDLLGSVAPFPDKAPSFLHLDRGDARDPYLATSLNPRLRDLRRPVDDPIRYMSPVVDRVAPVVDDLHFRIAAHDRSGVLVEGEVAFRETERGDNQYFTTATAQNHLLVGGQSLTTTFAGGVGLGGSAQIDIIASIYDKFAAADAPELKKLGVRSVWFNVTGRAFAASSGDVNPFRFEGEFAVGPADGPGAIPGHSYYSLRRHDLTRTVYENDLYSNSRDGGPYWYTVTNADDDALVEVGDRVKSWNTSVRAGKLWNDEGPAAARNADSQFPDDIYSVDVWAFDSQQNRSKVRTKTVLVDNWVQTLTATADAYTTDQKVTVDGGVQYRAAQKVWIYALNAEPADGENLAVADRKGQATADANGVLGNTDLGPFGEGKYWLVADYNNDGKYQPQLDGIKAIAVDKAKVASNLGSIRNPSVDARGQ